MSGQPQGAAAGNRLVVEAVHEYSWFHQPWEEFGLTGLPVASEHLVRLHQPHHAPGEAAARSHDAPAGTAGGSGTQAQGTARARVGAVARSQGKESARTTGPAQTESLTDLPSAGPHIKGRPHRIDGVTSKPTAEAIADTDRGRRAEHVYTDPTDVATLEKWVEELVVNAAVRIVKHDGDVVEGMVRLGASKA
ncbi:DUF3247 family protein [Dyella nitratireducens]